LLQGIEIQPEGLERTGRRFVAAHELVAHGRHRIGDCIQLNARQWDDETIRPRDAAATILVLWGVALATIAVIAIVEVQP
jgi:hypothetical protein